VFGALIAAVLAILAARLWVMQVAEGSAYALQAKQNRVREVTLEAPRGQIFDRNGEPLVVNRAVLVVMAEPGLAYNEKAGESAEEQAKGQVKQNLSTLLGVPVSEIEEKLASKKENALAPRVIATDVSLDKIAYLAEHASEFEGIEVRSRAVRQYPQGRLAAHVLGYAGEISDSQLSGADYAGYDPTDIVGKTGAELSFENVLHGDRGARILEVTAGGRPRRMISETQPNAGKDIVLTIDSEIQKVAEEALVDALADAHRNNSVKAKSGAAVAVDVTNGEVVALASCPTFDPALFVGGISQETWAEITDKSSEYPLSNRAIAGLYPPASTFKAITGLAGLDSGLTSAVSSYYCPGRWIGMGEQWGKWCWLHSGHKSMSFRGGVEESCDAVFYEIGYAFYKNDREGIQRFAREFGYGSRLGIDLPGERAGRMPDAKWKKEFNEDYPEYQRWLPGDTVNLAIGQGDTLVTPLQVAMSYAAIANGGTLYKPHVLKEVLSSDGNPVVTVEPTVIAEPDVSDEDLRTMRTALKQVVRTGTGKSAFRGFNVSVAGKTGTAEVAGKDDFAWFVGYAPADSPKYCVAVVIEQGGSGGSVAAPAARQILAALLGEKIEHVNATDNSR